MRPSKNKIKLAPRLRWGVGRDTNKISFYKIGGSFLLALSAVLIIRVGWLLLSPNESTKANPQVLGQTDVQEQNELFTEYQVKSGDTLFTIAQEYKVEWTMLATLNNLRAPFTLHSGQTIKIPKQ